MKKANKVVMIGHATVRYYDNGITSTMYSHTIAKDTEGTELARFGSLKEALTFLEEQK